MIELAKDGITMRVQTEGQASAFLNNGYKRVEQEKQQSKEVNQADVEKVENESDKQDEKAVEQATKAGKPAKN